MSFWKRPIEAAKSAVAAPIDGDRGHRRRREHEDAREAAHEVDARGDHRGRVDERGDRRGAGHRVGEPDVERDLRALAGAAEEDGEPDQRRRVDHHRLLTGRSTRERARPGASR